MVLYRKYRPQKLIDLDNESIRNRLISILNSSYNPHALLFTGPKGTGKTSTARIIAKILNCELRIKNRELSKIKNIENDQKLTTYNSQLITEIEPCNTCDSCKSITGGSHLDVLEIDAASNRGIDEIRDLREKIKLAPVSAKFKVYIIDEVHMLTTEAFNALLKTLEEPPPHAVFILATTEADKLPGTIVSRCLRISFTRATIEEVKRSLERVIKGEKLTVSEEVKTLIAEVSDGSFRDATKYLEQLISEKADTYERVLKMLGKGDREAEKILLLLKEKNTNKLLVEIKSMIENGSNIRFLVEEILKILHDLLLANYKIGEDKIPGSLKGIYEVKEISELIKLFSRVYIEIKGTAFPYLPLEVAVVEWCENSD